jgi:hypothetical protein
MFYRRLVMTLAVSALAGAAMAQTTTTGTITRESNLPAVGLAPSETAQVNVVNLATASSSGTAASCSGTIAFVNGSGATIGTATPVTVTSGEIKSASLPFSMTGAASRTEIRAVLTLTETSGSGVPCALSSSFETYDTASGVTHVYVVNAEAGPYGPIVQPTLGH